MKIRIIDNLPIVSLIVEHEENRLHLQNVLLDSGSQTTLLPFDQLIDKHIYPQANAKMQRMTGIGDGQEWVVEMQLDKLSVGSVSLQNCPVQVGNVAYGFGFEGIIGFDFLRETGAILNFDTMTLSKEG